MLFLVELDHVNSGAVPTYEEGEAFIEQIILPTLARAEQLIAEKKIVCRGAAAGGFGLRMVVEARAAADAEEIVFGLPLWPLAERRVTPLVTLAELLESVRGRR